MERKFLENLEKVHENCENAMQLITHNETFAHDSCNRMTASVYKQAKINPQEANKKIEEANTLFKALQDNADKIRNAVETRVVIESKEHMPQANTMKGLMLDVEHILEKDPKFMDQKDSKDILKHLNQIENKNNVNADSTAHEPVR